MQKFVIDRYKWLRGEGCIDSFLYRERDGKMCCLGQIGEQCGLSIEQLSDTVTPGETEDPMKFPSTLIDINSKLKNRIGQFNSALAGQMMKVNDKKLLSDNKREECLQELALKGGFELEFTN